MDAMLKAIKLRDAFDVRSSNAPLLPYPPVLCHLRPQAWPALS